MDAFQNVGLIVGTVFRLSVHLDPERLRLDPERLRLEPE
jgi:hypothetical protein